MTTDSTLDEIKDSLHVLFWSHINVGIVSCPGDADLFVLSHFPSYHRLKLQLLENPWQR